MAILTASDKATFFPSVTLTEDALTGLLTRAQVLAESDLGANRPLEQETTVELVRISKQFQSGQLARFPVLASPAPVVDVRVGQTKTPFGRAIPQTSWARLPNTSYSIDYEDGRINLFVASSFGFSVGLYYATEARVEYTSGFDFATNTAEIRSIKAVVGQLATYLWVAEGGAAPSSGTGPITRIDVDGEYSLSFGNGIYNNSDSRQAMSNILLPLKKYAPRGFR